METTSFNIISTGQILKGFSEQQAVSAMAALFKISTERATAYLGNRRTLKTQLDESKAVLYKRKLESIGLLVEIEKITPAAPKLSLEPLALQPLATDPQTSPPTANTTATHAPEFSCPKCGLAQKRAEQCVGCGVFMHKVLAKTQAIPNAAALSNSPPDAVVEDLTPVQSISPAAIGVAVAAAFAGALLWKFIALVFHIELGLIAWGIGGAIGFAAAAMGARGMPAAVLCAALAFFAIMGGKYLVIQSLHQNMVGMLTSNVSDEEWQQAYNDDLELARNYVNNVVTDSEVRQFMVDNYYSEADNAEQVTSEEVVEFKLSTEPHFRELANNPQGYEQWRERTLGAVTGTKSTWALVKEDFGALDFLFLFLGIGTAFRLARGNEG